MYIELLYCSHTYCTYISILNFDIVFDVNIILYIQTMHFPFKDNRISRRNMNIYILESRL